jgi:hypothetical protein
MAQVNKEIMFEETNSQEINENNTQVIKESLNKETLEKILDEYTTKDNENFTILNTKDFSKIYESLLSNNFLSDEMKNNVKEFRIVLESNPINYIIIDSLMTKIIRYYKLNTSTLALSTYNDKVKGDVENITRVLKAFVLKNRNTVYENTKHIILDKKPVSCEFNITVSAENLHLFDIFEKVSLNNLEEVLPQAKVIFTDIYTCWVLAVILAISLDKTDYVSTNKDSKKSRIDILREKIALLNTDSTNQRIKALINVVKKEKATSVRPKKAKEVVSNEDKEAIKKLSLRKPKKNIIKHKEQISVDHSNLDKDIENDLDITSEDIVQNGDIVM